MYLSPDANYYLCRLPYPYCRNSHIIAILSAVFSRRALDDTFGKQIRARLSRDDDDDTTVQVADRFIRYLNDSEVVDIIRDAQRGRKENVFRTITRLIGESVDALAETRAMEQLDAAQQPFSCPTFRNCRHDIGGRA